MPEPRRVVEVIDDATAAMHRAMTPAQRIAAACDAHDTAFAMTLARVRRQHPGWTESDLRRETARRLTVNQRELLAHVATTLDRLGVPHMVVGCVHGVWYYSEGGSDKHLRDIAGILRVSGEHVDRADVTAWATQLGYLDLWERVQKSVDDPNHPKV